jgi:formylglycine-generating enzyme required for sulfatase activity
MHGNVYEWCEDAYHASYEGAPDDGAPWLVGGEECEPGVPYRVYRGGSWVIRAWFSRASIRIWVPPTYQAEHVGFRPAFSNPAD